MNPFRSFRKIPPMQRFLLASGAAAFFALYVLTLTTDHDSGFSSLYWFAVLVCTVLTVCMLAVIIRYIILIIRDKHNRVFGSQIARRLSFVFTMVAVLPGLFLLGMSAQFISHNIKSWFGNDTRAALNSSLKLSQSAVNGAVLNSETQARLVRDNIVATLLQQDNLLPAFRTRQAQQFSQLVVWDLDSGKAAWHFNPHRLPPPRIDDTARRNLMQPNHNSVRGAEKLNRTLYARGWLRLPTRNGRHYALFFRQPIPADVARDAELIESARAKYAQLTFAQEGLQILFLIALLAAAALSMLLALAAALYFARRFVEPIMHLSDGAKAVAQGDFRQRIAVISKDELGQLAGLFNHMSEQLAIAKQADEQHRIEQEAARHYLERVLNSLSAGVITFDASGCLNTFNRSAETILDMPLQALLGQSADQWKSRSAKHALLADTLAELMLSEKHEQAVETAYTGADESRILLGKAIRLPEENGNGIVLVFDNITTLVLAQKEAAWREVAKRLAHEIRNPLTPIQLSAERLAWKLGGKLNESDEKTLTKSTDTIIKQVAALKEMVEAFRNYARAPSLNMSEIDLNKLIAEVLVLYESTPCTFCAEFSKMPMLLKADTTAMRQVLHNLFKNAAEAAEAAPQPQVCIRTAIEDHSGSLTLTVANNGKAFSKAMLQSAFEPYITDKPSGTGLGLSVVRKIVEEHNGKIILANQEGGGACVTLKFTPETL